MTQPWQSIVDEKFIGGSGVFTAAITANNNGI